MTGVDLSPIADIIEAGGHARYYYIDPGHRGSAWRTWPVTVPVSCCAAGALYLWACREFPDVLPRTLGAAYDDVIHFWSPAGVAGAGDAASWLRPQLDALHAVARRGLAEMGQTPSGNVIPDVAVWSDRSDTGRLLAQLRGTT